MDDFLVFSDTKEELLEKTRKIETYMQDKLRLTIKPPIIVKTTKGVCFLGYKLYREKVFLSSRSKKRLIKKMNLYFDLLRKNIWDEQTYNSHIVPLIAFSSHANSKGLRRMILSKQI